jgi:hypothetical protein
MDWPIFGAIGGVAAAIDIKAPQIDGIVRVPALIVIAFPLVAKIPAVAPSPVIVTALLIVKGANCKIAPAS